MPRRTRQRILSEEEYTSAAASSDDDAVRRTLPPPADPKTRAKSFKTRTYSTLLLLAAAFYIVFGVGHWGMYLMIILIQFVLYKEMTGLAYLTHMETKLNRAVPFFRTVMWGFLGCTLYYTHGISLRPFVVGIPSLSFFVQFHTFISYCAWMAVFVLFVLSLRKGLYKYMFKQFAFTHMALLFIIGPTTLGSRLIFSGFFWLLLSVSLMVINDIFAYICGFLWGRTPLIKLSPKKTWEGFIGGSIFTIIGALLLSWIMAHFEGLVCPKTDLTWDWPSCAVPAMFQPHYYPLPVILAWIPRFFGMEPMLTWFPAQFHAIILALFASVIAPFGGFFASGFKRGAKIKDFGDSIPGHGGFTDRFDCHIVMQLFAAMYVSYIVQQPVYEDVTSVIELIGTLSLVDQQKILATLKEMLDAQ